MGFYLNKWPLKYGNYMFMCDNYLEET